MKDKTLTAILALFLGFWGVHRFYLRQTGLGVLYFLLSFVGIGFLLGFIDFFAFLFMDKRVFDLKYNSDYYGNDSYRYDTDFIRRRKNTRRFQEEYEQRRREPAPPPRRFVAETPPPAPSPVQVHPMLKRGMERYRNFDYEGAILDFKTALKKEPKSVPLHFNIACAYSLTEQEDQAFFHLNKAVENGFKDFEKIRSHEALAYLRLQDEFETFAQNGYRFKRSNEKPVDKSLITSNPDLLEQLNQLGELRKRGLLTEEEFLVQKKKLLR